MLVENMDLVIVESGAKSKTIQKYLGSDYYVEACVGHIQNLPSTPSPHPDTSKALWNSKDDELPSPPWDWVYRKSGNRVSSSEKIISEILKKAKSKKVKSVYVATDPDREGEFIAWRLFEIFTENGYENIFRITFNEITESAVTEALSNPTKVDMNLVEGAIVRILIDRLVGYRASNFAKSWDLASMGRVQTPTCGFLVEREMERDKFKPIPYYSVKVNCEGVVFSVIFHDKDDKDAWADGDGKINKERTFDAELATHAIDSLNKNRAIHISDVNDGTYSRNPKPAFETQTLIKTAGVTLGWSSSNVMKYAAELYNAGHTTYMRTDSTRTSTSARESVRSYISQEWGDDYLGAGVIGKSKSKQNVQDAHEAIRPTRPDVRMPDGLSLEQAKLYKLIWARFAASQMSKSAYERRTLICNVDGFEKDLRGTVSWCTHLGWELAFSDVKSLPPTSPPDFDFSTGNKLTLDDEEENPKLIDEETKPPPRYKEHTLIEEMKSRGIGRPSTWVGTINKLKQKREYRNRKTIPPYCVLDDGGSLVPTDNGKLMWQEVAPYYEAPVDDGTISFLFSPEFTADLEVRLDLVESGDRSAGSVYHGFLKHFKNIHETAQEKKREKPTFKQKNFFERHCKRLSSDEIEDLLNGKSVDELTGSEMSDILDKLVKKGTPPSDKQIDFIKVLMTQCEMDEKEALELVELQSLDELTSKTASNLIKALKEKTGPSPASEKQVKFIETLVEQAELDEEKACALVDLKSYSELSGGREGNASQLIGLLRKKLGMKGRGRRKQK